jgi:hypothetical protein
MNSMIMGAFTVAAVIVGMGTCSADTDKDPAILGITGKVSNVAIAIPAVENVGMLSQSQVPKDIDLKGMAAWAMNYLIETPRKKLGYEPVFQCYPLRCPPIPEGHDPVVACDTDARMEWEWYYMREISESKRGLDVEAAFHRRMRDYIGDDGRVWSHPGAYNEADINAVYEKKDYVFHLWGATKILKSLSEEYTRTKNPESKALAHKIMLAMKSIATWDDKGRCYLRAGMGAYHADGSVVRNDWWNQHPAPIVEPLVSYWQSTGDKDALTFAKAYAQGMMDGIQPDGIRFASDGSFPGQSHAVLHATWGVAHLGVATGDRKYIDFAKRVSDWLLSRGTGTGWFPANGDHLDETCCLSDMMSINALIGQAGHAEYFDYVERYMRNYISNTQFFVTPEFEAYYRRLHKSAREEDIAKSLDELRKFQGGIIGGSGLNDIENDLLGGALGYALIGCCAPEGMRAIYTTWNNVIDRLPKSPLGPAGVYVNMSFTRDSKWGQVVSFVPDGGRLSVKSAVKDAFFLRPPSWATRGQVRAFANAKPVPVEWSGAYVRFEANPGDELTITYPVVSFTHQVEGLWSGRPNLKVTFKWQGNMVVSVDPPAEKTPLFTGSPRILPPAPSE